MRRLAIIILGLTTAGLALVLSSCSSPISYLSSSSASNIIALQQASDAQMVGMLAPSQSFAPLALSSQQLSTSGLQPMGLLICPTLVSWGQNVDGDLAPTNGELTYAACPGTNGVTASGTFTIVDNADNMAYSGFNAALKNYRVTVTSLNTSLTVDGTFDISEVGSASPPSYDISYGLNIGIAVTGVVSGSVDMSGSPTFTSTVTDGSNPYVSGTFYLSGSATFDTSNGYHYSLTRTGQAVITTTCVGALASGSDITYMDGNGNALEISYTSCGHGNWYYTPSGGTTSSGTAF